MAGMVPSSLGIGTKPSRFFTRFGSLSVPFYSPSRHLYLGFLQFPIWRPNPYYISLSMPCSCSSSDLVPEDLRLVSTTECSDGSVLFRFGDASTMPEIVEKDEEKAEKPASGVLSNTELEDFNIVEALKMDCESEIRKNDLVDSIKIETKSFSSFGQSRLPAETDDFLNQMPVSVEDTKTLSSALLRINDVNISCASAGSDVADLIVGINNEGRFDISSEINTSSVASMTFQASNFQMNQGTSIHEDVASDKRESENVNQLTELESFFKVPTKDQNVGEKNNNELACHSRSASEAQEMVLNEKNISEKEENERVCHSMSESEAQQTVVNEQNVREKEENELAFNSMFESEAQQIVVNEKNVREKEKNELTFNSMSESEAQVTVVNMQNVSGKEENELAYHPISESEARETVVNEQNVREKEENELAFNSMSESATQVTVVDMQNVSGKEEDELAYHPISESEARETVLNEQNVSEKEENELACHSISESEAQEMVLNEQNGREKEENHLSCHSISESEAQETVLNEQNVSKKEENELSCHSLSDSKALEKVTIFDGGNTEDIIEGDLTMIRPALLNDDPVLDGEIIRSSVEDSDDSDRIDSSNAELSNGNDMYKRYVEKESSLESKDMQIGGNLKGKEILTDELILFSGAALLPHPSKALAGGENAYFVVSNWLGVADGIGQWTFEGTKAGGFARDLMENFKRSILDSKNVYIQNPAELLTICVRETQSSGLATVLVGYFDGQAFHVVNIGDSGFFIIRNGAIVNRSSFMIHEFIFPVQIEKGDDAAVLMEDYKVELEEGDVIIAATDALFDNLYEQEIVSILLKSIQSNFKPQDIAEFLAKRAQDVGALPLGRSPFADAAQAAGYVGYTGGKLDAVAVIVSFVHKKEEVVLI